MSPPLDVLSIIYLKPNCNLLHKVFFPSFSLFVYCVVVVVVAICQFLLSFIIVDMCPMLVSA